MTRGRAGQRWDGSDVALARPPVPVAPPTWVFPEPATADLDGVVGVGADLDPATLVHAYRRGIFPWPHPGMALPWFSPDPRGLLSHDRLHVSRSLRRRLRTSGWEATVDLAFPAVVAACAETRPEGTWITRETARAYVRLHELGWAHSIEIWDGPALVGGLYGVQVGGCFTGESMFHRVTDASKAALVELVDRFDEAGGSIVDVQIRTSHLASMGATELTRARFLDLLAEVRDDDVRLTLARKPVARHA